MAKATSSSQGHWSDWPINLVLRGLMALVLALPYTVRVPLMGWLVTRVLSPLAGYGKRVRYNLDLVWPDLPSDQRRRIARTVPDNFGRTLIEIYSGREFKNRLRSTPLEGPGLVALQAAHDAGRPVILVSAHFGNHDAVRATVSDRFSPVGAIYRPLSNRYFNAHWQEAIEGIAAPAFARGRRGLAEMVKYLRAGNIIALLVDQHLSGGTELDFLGKPALTTLSAAELALKYDALLLPVFGLRNPDGLSFRPILQDPIPPSDAVTMSQEINNRLGAMIKEHPEQWFWVHRRWKSLS